MHIYIYIGFKKDFVVGKTTSAKMLERHVCKGQLLLDVYHVDVSSGV